MYPVPPVTNTEIAGTVVLLVSFLRRCLQAGPGDDAVLPVGGFVTSETAHGAQRPEQHVLQDDRGAGQIRRRHRRLDEDAQLQQIRQPLRVDAASLGQSLNGDGRLEAGVEPAPVWWIRVGHLPYVELLGTVAPRVHVRDARRHHHPLAGHRGPGLGTETVAGPALQDLEGLGVGRVHVRRHSVFAPERLVDVLEHEQAPARLVWQRHDAGTLTDVGVLEPDVLRWCGHGDSLLHPPLCIYGADVKLDFEAVLKLNGAHGQPARSRNREDQGRVTFRVIRNRLEGLL